MPKFIEPEQEQTQPAQPEAQGAAGPSGTAAFAVRGDRDDDIKRQEAMDPSEVQEVTAEEQAQYTDFVTRCISCISDARVPEMEGGESPSDAVIKVMSNSSFSVPQALAEGAVSTIKIITDAAQRAGKPYTPDVIFHGADEVIAALYMLGAAAGIFDGASDYARGGGDMVPSATAGGAADEAAPPMAQAGGAAAIAPESGAQAQTAPLAQGPVGGDGDFSDDEYALFGEALMLATELFGRKLLDAGQLRSEEAKEAQSFWKQQIAKEVETGQVDDAMFDDLDVDSIRNQITKGVA